jgi:uncharacterized protein YggT (Ycf19 family)
MVIEIITTTLRVLGFLILIRALLSWVPGIIDPRSAIAEFLVTVTEQILAPIRNLMPRMMLDFSPMIAIFILFAVAQAIAQNG